MGKSRTQGQENWCHAKLPTSDKNTTAGKDRKPLAVNCAINREKEKKSQHQNRSNKRPVKSYYVLLFLKLNIFKTTERNRNGQSSYSLIHFSSVKMTWSNARGQEIHPGVQGSPQRKLEPVGRARTGTQRLTHSVQVLYLVSSTLHQMPAFVKYYQKRYLEGKVLVLLHGEK